MSWPLVVAKRFWTSDDSPLTCQPLVRYESADVHTHEKCHIHAQETNEPLLCTTRARVLKQFSDAVLQSSKALPATVNSDSTAGILLVAWEDSVTGTVRSLAQTPLKSHSLATLTSCKQLRSAEPMFGLKDKPDHLSGSVFTRFRKSPSLFSVFMLPFHWVEARVSSTRQSLI